MSSTHLQNKLLIKSFSDKIYNANSESIHSVLQDYYHEDTVWHGPHPLNDINGREELANKFWKPFFSAFPDVQKNPYILFGGSFNGTDWVCSTGNFVGTFTKDWLDIPATKGAVWIRYGEFNKMVDGKIAESYIIIDLLDLIRQVGFRFIPSLAPEIVISGPATFDGLLLGASDERESKKSLELVENMIYKGLASFKDKGFGKMGMELYWHPDFMWYGPCGIGSTRGIKGFEEYHQNPFLKGIPDRVGGNHKARFAEGNYIASTGWPSITATHTGPDWLGLPATNKPITMRVMDWWRREGDLLVENWVFIDLIDVLLQLEIDVFDRLRNRKHLITCIR